MCFTLFKGKAVTEEEIEDLVFSRELHIEVTTSWTTPSGNPRKAPVYEIEISNEYLNKHKNIKDRCTDTIQNKANACLTTWAHQEVKKRIQVSKQNAKEQAKDEAVQRSAEASDILAELNGILQATLSIDDKIDWEAERDTRSFDAFSYPSVAPKLQQIEPPTFPPEPGLTWLFRARHRRWQAKCDVVDKRHASAKCLARRQWDESVLAHNAERDAAKRKHSFAELAFRQEQLRVNTALAEFQKNFEAGEPASIIEYCMRVFELSQYPEELSLNYSIAYDKESNYLEVDIELPPQTEVPVVASYKFVSAGNQVEPVALKKKEANLLYETVLDQVVLRTLHEIFESCYIPQVTGAIVNGLVTSINPATGLAEEKRVRSVVADRTTFEAFDLSRIEPAACIDRLAQGVGQITRTGTA